MTDRRRRTRKKDLKHGDLFHVYIASDTPPEVCEFLSRLKRDGDFSYEILQIIAAHVHGTEQASMKREGELDGVSAVDKAVTTVAGMPAEAASAAVSSGTDTVSEPGKSAGRGMAEKPDPIQLLRQQRRAWVANSNT